MTEETLAALERLAAAAQDDDDMWYLAKQVPGLVTEIRRFRDGLIGLRRGHIGHLEGSYCDNPECGAEISASCAAYREDFPHKLVFVNGIRPACTCGADVQNAYIDALLKGPE